MTQAQRYASLRRVDCADVDTLAEVLSREIGTEHGHAVARVIVECGHSAEEIICVNGYGSDGNPELHALARAGWPLAETRAAMERWAAEAWNTDYVRDVCRARGEVWP